MYHHNCMLDGAYVVDYTSCTTVVIAHDKRQHQIVFMLFGEQLTLLVYVASMTAEEKGMKAWELVSLSIGRQAKKNSRAEFRNLGVRFYVG